MAQIKFWDLTGRRSKISEGNDILRACHIISMVKVKVTVLQLPQCKPTNAQAIMF